MAPTYKTPGVYIEDIAKFPPSVAPVETALPAFIGYTQKAEDKAADDLILKPTRISSLAEYEVYFGGPQNEQKISVRITAGTVDGTVTDSATVAELGEADRSRHILHHALQLFFANGGGPCIIISAGLYKAVTGTPLILSELDQGLTAIGKEDGPTLLVIPEAIHLGIADFRTLMDKALAQCATLMDRFLIMDVHGDSQSMADPHANLLTGIRNFREDGVGTDNLKCGAAYAPYVETVLDFAYDASMVQVIVTTDGTAAEAVTLQSLEAADNARFLRAQAAIRDLPCTLPPSGAVAGVYAATDSNRGVWKAPANVSLAAVIRPTIDISKADQDEITIDATAGKSVNAIRAFTGKGTLVWGGRTLRGNDNEWRYVSVRRFFTFVETSVRKATQPFVFEPNDANSWVKMQGMIENFLTTLWRQGALQGSKPEQAFYVNVGLGKTMTALDILEGRMIVEVGMAPVRPAEFIILRFTHKMAEA